MLKQSERFSTALAAELPGARADREMVLLKPVNHFVRGFLLERTLEKNVFYLWCMVVPLFLPMRNITLNYSRRVRTIGGEELKLDLRTDIAAVVAATSALLHEKYFAELQNISTPRDFLQLFDCEANYNRPNMVVELAIARCLAGQGAIGKAMLKQVMSDHFDSPVLPLIRQYAGLVLDALARGDDAFRKQISAFEQLNLHTLFRGMVNDDQTNLHDRRS